jgi:hypothetical protein
MEKDSQTISLLDVKGLINTLFNNLTGSDAETWLKQFKRFLRKESSWSRPSSRLWMSVSIEGKSGDELMNVSNKAGFIPSYNAMDIVMSDQFKPMVGSEKANFIKSSIKEFGFTGTTFSQLIEFFKNHPLFEICRPEDAWYVRMLYIDQPDKEKVYVAMDLIDTSSNGPSGFALVYDNEGPCIYAYTIIPENTVIEDSLWLVRFRSPESQVLV